MIDTYKVRIDALLDERDDGDVIFMLCDEIDRLRGEQQTQQGKTVEVRIPVEVGPDGAYMPRMDFGRKVIKAGNVIYTLTATLPVPAEVCVVANVEGE